MKIDLFAEEQYPNFGSRDCMQLDNFITAEKEHPKAKIFLSDETGETLWVVAFVGWEEFWLMGSPKRKDAVKFCEHYEIEVEK